MFNRIFAAAAVGTMMIATPALAGDDHGQKTAVTYADLNLNTEAGQAALERRVLSAVREVCNADAARTGTRLMSNDRKKCLAEAKKSAKQQVATIIEGARRGG